MPGPSRLDDVTVLGKLPPERAAAKLRELGEDEAADALERAQHERPVEHFGRLDWMWPFQDRPWQYTAHALGHLAPAPGERATLTATYAPDTASVLVAPLPVSLPVPAP